MKFDQMRLIFTFILSVSLYLPSVWAYGSGDFMRETGKIGVVFGVVLLIFAGLIWYMVRLDRKLTKLEQQIKDDQ